jgi:hypothetical protein
MFKRAKKEIAEVMAPDRAKSVRTISLIFSVFETVKKSVHLKQSEKVSNNYAASF